MSVTDNFAKLKEQVEKADRTVKAAAEQNQAEIQAKVNEARRDADERAAELRAKGDEAGKEGESHWREMQADLGRHIERVRQRMDAKGAEVDAKEAGRDADWAEADAEDAIAFAMSAIVEAEYATLDAMLARERDPPRDACKREVACSSHAPPISSRFAVPGLGERTALGSRGCG
jgi:DNA repair exonuclease SbcCD ATPase subunit